jgi:murein DD-endopeptidase MepM/ murein hydrolase activator NlpD
MTPPITLRETFGLDPLPLRAREAWLALRGDANVPPTRFGPSSLGIFHPSLSIKTWLGGRRADHRVPISCLYNRTPTPLSEGWSVRKTQVRDFRGGTLTYDSHNGTDFAVPVGTIVCAAAPGRVLRISSEYNRGGLKVFLDHGDGLVTTQNHLARSLVRVGDVVRRGDPIALSGYSGIDALVAFPWSVPHVHFNVWLDGDYVDPFAAAGETSLWIGGNDPRPATDAAELFTPTAWDASAVDAAIAECKDAELRATLRAEPDPARRAMDVLFFRNYYPTRFSTRPALYAHRHERSARLTLPFRREDFLGIAFAA